MLYLQVTQRKTNHHKDSVTGLGWSVNELLTVSDDKTIAKWNLDGEVLTTLCDLESYAVDIHWFPRYLSSLLLLPSFIIIIYLLYL